MVLLFNNNKKQYKKTVMSDYLFIVFLLLLNIHRSGVLTLLAWQVPLKTAAISAPSVYTIQP